MLLAYMQPYSLHMHQNAPAPRVWKAAELLSNCKYEIVAPSRVNFFLQWIKDMSWCTKSQLKAIIEIGMSMPSHIVFFLSFDSGDYERVGYGLRFEL